MSDDPGSDPPDDVSCESCGSFNVVHVQEAPTARHRRCAPRARSQYFNRCLDCNHRGDYAPSKAVIAAECEVIRDARPVPDPEWYPPDGGNIYGVDRNRGVDHHHSSTDEWNYALRDPRDSA